MNSSYKCDINAIGLKLLGSLLFPFLYIKVVVDIFQADGICFWVKQRLKILVRTLQFGSTCLRCQYSTRTLPGAELDKDQIVEIIQILVGRVQQSYLILLRQEECKHIDYPR